MKKYTFLAIAILLFTFRVDALSVKSSSVEDMAQKSEIVVVGRVLSAYAEMDHEQGRLYTYITISADEYMKGKSRPKNLVIKVQGGIYGDKMLMIDGAADFYRNEDVMLFLSRRYDGSYFPLGYGLGKFSIYQDVETQRRVLVSTPGRGRYFPQTRNAEIDGLNPEQKLFLDDVRVRTHRAIELKNAK